MSKKFSELPPKDSLDSADYIPIVDSADSDPETQNKIVTFQTVRGYFTEDLDEFLATAQAHESARVSAENTRRSNETTRQSREDTRESNEATRQSNEATRQANEATREDAETGYIQQAKSWAVGTNGVARAGDATDNAKYYAEQAGASATSASTSATNASASETSAATSAQSAQASATQAAISAESVDAPALTEKILAAFPQESLSGQLLTLTDGADGIPAKSLTLNLSPHQSGSGDPSPENVRSISGYQSVTVYRTGKNMLDPSLCVERTHGGVTRKVNADGTITLTGTPTQANIFWKSTDDMNIPIKAGTYAMETFNSKCILRLSFKKATGITSNVFTLTEDDEIVNVRFVLINASVDLNDVFSPMLVAGGTIPTDFEPYQGETYTITVPTSAGTVYGGQLTVDQDGSGTLVATHGIVNASSLTWRADSTRFYASAPMYAQADASHKIAWCNCLKLLAEGGTALDGAVGFTMEGNQRVYIANKPSTTTLDELNALIAATGMCFVLPLATPQTYTLTTEQVTTLLGDNTVWMDADGSIDLQYRADTQKYIDSRIELLNSNLAYIEDGTTASRAYSVGQYVLIGGQLYKVTASIASGATFTIGTNVVSTTVGTELTALQ